MGVANKLDRAVLAVFPAAGLRRISARAKASALMNYDAASKGRRAYGWKAPGSDADAASLASRRRLRQLSRDMIRNREYAARAQSVVVNNVVGKGIMPSVITKDDALRKSVDAAIADHFMTTDIDAAGIHTLSGIQRMAMNAVFSDGEVLVRRRQRAGIYASNLSLPFQIEILEADFLDETKVSNGQNEIIDGVEYGPTGRVEAYWIYKQHPGTASRKIDLKSSRVPASEVLHIRRLDRPGQVRGVPWLAPVMMKLGELSDYQEAQILKQRMAALLAAVIVSDDAVEGANTEKKGIEELAPGAVVHVGSGSEVSFTEPPQVNGYDEFMRQGLAAIAMGVGITYEALAGDLSGVNFSSARMGRMEMDCNIETWQTLVMILQFCNGVGRWFSEAWRLKGRGQADEFSIGWTAPRRALVDPTKEIPALQKKITSGITSRQRVQRELGLDPDQIRRERIEDDQKDQAANLGTSTPEQTTTSSDEGDNSDSKEDAE